MISWFCEWRRSQSSAERVSDSDLRAVASVIRTCKSIRSATLLRPIPALDPHYPNADQSPALVAQLDFVDVDLLETALGKAGPLAVLTEPALFPSLRSLAAIQEAMLRRSYPVHSHETAAADAAVTYLVTYTGAAEDEQAWHAAYLARHRVLLSKLTGLCQLEIFTPATIVSGLALPFVRSLQRNKTVFLSASSMKEAMLSDVRDELRADFHQFPKFTGESRHEPYETIPLN